MKAMLEEMLRPPELHELWHVLLAKYKDVGFTDNISDKTRIEEFTWICQQLRKTFAKKQRAYQDKDPEDIVKDLEAYRFNRSFTQAGYPEDRRELVFTMMREEWIDAFIDKVTQHIEEEKEMDSGTDYVY